MNIIKGFKGLSVSAGLAMGYLFQDAQPALYALVLIVAVDYISGMLKAVSTKTVSSRIGMVGIVKKVFMLSIITVTALIDIQMNLHSVLTSSVIFYYMANEVISIIENAASLGIPIPNALREVLIQLKGDKVAEPGVTYPFEAIAGLSMSHLDDNIDVLVEEVQEAELTNLEAHFKEMERQQNGRL